MRDHSFVQIGDIRTAGFHKAKRQNTMNDGSHTTTQHGQRERKRHLHVLQVGFTDRARVFGKKLGEIFHEFYNSVLNGNITILIL